MECCEMAMSCPLLPLPASVAAKSIRLAVLVGSVWSCFIALSGMVSATPGLRERRTNSGEDVKIVSVSVDDRENSEALVEKRKRGFPVAYHADARAVFAATRAFANDASVYLEATGFGDRRERPSDARRCAGFVPQVVSSAKNRGTAADWRGGR
jgi:hypothetical protein